MAEKKFYEDLIASEQVFDGKLLHVLRDRVRLPNGDESLREYIRHPGAVVVIAFPTTASCCSSASTAIPCSG